MTDPVSMRDTLGLSADEFVCDTCDGEGTIDERLGGYSFSDPAAKCPDCDGRGWWRKSVALAPLPEPESELGHSAGTLLEVRAAETSLSGHSAAPSLLLARDSTESGPLLPMPGDGVAFQALAWANAVHALKPLLMKDCHTLDDLEAFLRQIGGCREKPKPAAWVVRCHQDTMDYIEGQILWGLLTERGPFECAAPDVWECVPVYLGAKANSPDQQGRRDEADTTHEALTALIAKWRHAADHLGIDGLASLADCADELELAIAATDSDQKGRVQTAGASGSDSQTDPQSEVSQQGSVPSPEASGEARLTNAFGDPISQYDLSSSGLRAHIDKLEKS